MFTGSTNLVIIYYVMCEIHSQVTLSVVYGRCFTRFQTYLLKFIPSVCGDLK